jgi:signal transduction histidine kinase
MNLNDMLEEVTTLYDEIHTKVAIELELDGRAIQIMADAVRLRQLVHNLIKNSLETIEADGWIKLQTRSLREFGVQYAELIVEDSGDGIADEVADNLFDPYVTTKTTGSGLGLAIVKKIVDEHNGVVWVEKGSKRGARFIIRLPAISASSDDMAGTEDATSSVEIVP